MRDRVFLAPVVLVLAALISGCAGSSQTTTAGQSPTGGVSAPTGRIVLAQSRDIDSLDPAYSLSRQSANVGQLIFECLVARPRADDMSIEPGLAESWKVVDETTWRFSLRKGVTFHDGKKLTAADVKFSIERLMDPATKSNRTATEAVKEVRVVDDFTVDVITKAPYAPLLTKLVNVEIMSAETFKTLGADGYAKNPVGTGPFAFKEWVKGERVVLTANPRYWGGAPKVAQVVVVPIPDTAARIAALESAGIDIAAELPADYQKSAKGGAKQVDTPGTRVFYVGLNVNQKPFTDVRVRQALNHAVNVPELVSKLLNGQAEVLRGPVFKTAFGFSDAVAGYQYDATKAKALLRDAGYADGFEATLDVAPVLKEMAEAVAGQLQPLGVRIKVNVLETAALYAKYEPGNSQMYLSSWGISELDADVVFATQLLSTRKTKYTNYANPELDPFIQRGASTADPAARKAAYKSAIEIVVRDAPWIFLYSPTESYGVRGSVQGWKPRPDGRLNLLTATAN